MNGNFCKMHPVFKYVVLAAFAVAFHGCATVNREHKLLNCEKTPKIIDWITVSGSMLPTSTLTVGQHGSSLADCLVQSQTLDRLHWQADVTAKNAVSNQTLTQSDSLQIETMALSQKDTAGNYDSMVAQVAAIMQNNPGVGIPSDWYKGFPEYAFDDKAGSEYEKRLIALHVDALEPAFKKEAASHFITIAASNATEQDVLSSRDSLKTLARDGKLNVEDHQKLKAWCYFRAHIAKNSKDASDSKVDTFTVKNQNALVLDNGPVENLMMVLVHRKQECVLVPLPLVFESAFGGYWVEPGDHIILARYKELPFIHFADGEKRVGLVGLTTSQGVWPTEQRSLEAAMSNFGENVDLRANMITITQKTDKLMLRAMLPLNTMALSPSRSAQMRDLLRVWGLFDGQVIEFQNSGLNKLLNDSNRKLQLATDANRTKVNPCFHSCVDPKCTHESTQGIIATDAKGTNGSTKQQFPFLTDTCENIQQNLKSVSDSTSRLLGMPR